MIHIDTPVKLFLGVLVVIVALLVLIYAPKAADYIKDTLLNMGGEYGITADTEAFNLAVECAYYRCTEGCDGNKVKTIFVDGTHPFRCKEDFCSNDVVARADTNGDGRICGDETRENPVTLTIENQFKIKPTSLTEPIQIVTPCGNIGSNLLLAGDMADVPGVGLVSSIMNIEAELTVKKSSESCGSQKWYPINTQGDSAQAYTVCEMDKATYYIWFTPRQIGLATMWEMALCNNMP